MAPKTTLTAVLLWDAITADYGLFDTCDGREVFNADFYSREREVNEGKPERPKEDQRYRMGDGDGQ